MTMPAPSSAPPPYYQQRRGNGCLWGCLIAAAILLLPPVLAGGYGAWFFLGGYKREPVLRLAGELVRQDGLARQALGDGAVITGFDSNDFSWVTGMATSSYDVILEGPKGEGHLAVSAHHTTFGAPQLDSAILTGPDGRRYDLLKHQVMPSPGEIDRSI